MTPPGPNLTGIYGRPVGSAKAFRYSNAMHEVANSFVWDDETLDLWLTDSQRVIRGSCVFLKVKQPARGKIIGYLKTYSRYEN